MLKKPLLTWKGFARTLAKRAKIRMTIHKCFKTTWGKRRDFPGCLIYLSTVLLLVQLRYSLAVPWFYVGFSFRKRPVDVQRLFVTGSNIKAGE